MYMLTLVQGIIVSNVQAVGGLGRWPIVHDSSPITLMPRIATLFASCRLLSLPLFWPLLFYFLFSYFLPSIFVLITRIFRIILIVLNTFVLVSAFVIVIAMFLFFCSLLFCSDGQDCHLSSMIVRIILITSNLCFSPAVIGANIGFFFPVLVVNNIFPSIFFNSRNQCVTFALLVQCCRSQRDSATSAESDLKMAVLREAARLRLWLHNKIKEFSALV